MSNKEEGAKSRMERGGRSKEEGVRRKEQQGRRSLVYPSVNEKDEK